MNKNVIIWILSMVVTILLTAIITFLLLRPEWNFLYRQPCSPGFPPNNNLVEKLHLSPEQITAFEKLRTAHWQDVAVIHDSLYTYRLLLLDELEKEHPDTSIIRSTTQKISFFENKLQLSFIEHAFGVKKILTPGQQKIFFDHFRNRWEHRKKRGCGFLRGKG